MSEIFALPHAPVVYVVVAMVTALAVSTTQPWWTGLIIGVLLTLVLGVTESRVPAYGTSWGWQSNVIGSCLMLTKGFVVVGFAWLGAQLVVRRSAA